MFTFWKATKSQRLKEADPAASDVAEATPPDAAAVPGDHELEEDKSFSVLKLRDRVVIMLLFDQIVTEAQVRQVWTLHQQQEHKEPLWRMLAASPEIDRELVFQEAARVYGIEDARIMPRLAKPLVEQTARQLPASLWDRMVERRLVPVGEGERNHSHKQLVILASPDPTHPEVQRLLPELKLVGYELRYAPELEILALLAEAFPWKYRSLYEDLAKEQEDAAQRQAHHESASSAEATVDELDDEQVGDAMNSSSIIAFFEDLLVQGVRHGTSGICIAAGENAQTEIFLQEDEKLRPWQTAEHIAYTTLVATLKSVIIRDDLSILSQAQGQGIKRWIDGRLVRFRVTALPAGEFLDHEAILIRVLR